MCSFYSSVHHIQYMDKIHKNSFGRDIKNGECGVWHLLFADDLVLLSSSQSDLQEALHRFSDACSDVGMKISTAKIEVRCVSNQLM